MGYIGANDQLMPHLFPIILDTGGRSEPSVCVDEQHEEELMNIFFVQRPG